MKGTTLFNWQIESIAGMEFAGQCFHEDCGLKVNGYGTLSPNEVVEYPTDGSVPKLRFCTWEDYEVDKLHANGGNCGLAILAKGRGNFTLELTKPDGTILPGMPWPQKGSMVGFRRGSAPKFRCSDNVGTAPLSGLYGVRIIAGNRKVSNITVWIIVDCARCSWQKNYLDPADWNIVE